MSRFFVPLAFVAVISGLGSGLVVGVIARSPDTHANVRPEGYDRTPTAYLGEEPFFEGFGLAEPGLLTTADRVERGRLFFLSYGCAACHGLANQGGVVGPRMDPDQLTLSDLQRSVRSGPLGMPAFPEEILGDDDLEALYVFLTGSKSAAP